MTVPNRLPEFEGFTVDLRLKQFRKFDKKRFILEFLEFDSVEGKKLLTRFEKSIR